MTGITGGLHRNSGVMTDEQLNHLIAFLSRNKENIFLELKHVKEVRDKQAKVIEEQNHCLDETDEALREKDEVMKDMGAELTKKGRVIRSKDKRISDLVERLAEANESRYGRRGKKSKQSTKDDESGNSGKGSANGNDNPGGADRQQGEDECDGKTPYDPVTEVKLCHQMPSNDILQDKKTGAKTNKSYYHLLNSLIFSSLTTNAPPR